MQRLLAGIDWITDKVTLLILILLNLIVGVQVFSRYVLNHSLFWSEELARYLFIYLVFLSGAMVLRQDRHIQVTVLVDILPAPLRRAIIVLGELLMLGFAGVVLVESIRLAAMVGTVLTAAMEIPWSFVYLGIMLGMAIMVLALVGSLWARLTGRREERGAW
ncbi:MAG TPA: TRAP transporter small permease [Candidatus Methylomirabilis sp.]|nr:TRAP transporter small permease [Candidatus Methylomirabilis sp.]